MSSAMRATQPESHHAQHRQSKSMYQNTTGPSKDITANMAGGHRFAFTVETTFGKHWHASNLMFKKWQRVSDHSQHRGADRARSRD